ncbi:MAG: hypothetical protein ACRDRO_08225, partial [Pseudonocardiaceae bacterium]
MRPGAGSGDPTYRTVKGILAVGADTDGDAGASARPRLALLCGDEIARRDTAGLTRRLVAARFETTAAIEDFDFGYNPEIPAGVIRDLAS